MKTVCAPLSILAVMAIAMFTMGCPSSPEEMTSTTTPPAPTLSAADALDHYQIMLDSKATLSGEYANRGSTTVQVPVDSVLSDTNDVAGFDLSYDASQHHFIVTLNKGSPDPAPLYVDDRAVVAYDATGQRVPFSPTATNLSDVRITVVTAPQETTVANGCIQGSSTTLVFDIIPEGLTARFTTRTEFLTTSAPATSSSYVACDDWLATIQQAIKAGIDSGSAVDLYVKTKAVDINDVPDLTAVELEARIIGQRQSKPTLARRSQAGSSAARAVVIESGAIASIRFQK